MKLSLEDTCLSAFVITWKFRETLKKINKTINETNNTFVIKNKLRWFYYVFL